MTMPEMPPEIPGETPEIAGVPPEIAGDTETAGRASKPSGKTGTTGTASDDYHYCRQCPAMFPKTPVGSNTLGNHGKQHNRRANQP